MDSFAVDNSTKKKYVNNYNICSVDNSKIIYVDNSTIIFVDHSKIISVDNSTIPSGNNYMINSGKNPQFTPGISQRSLQGITPKSLPWIVPWFSPWITTRFPQEVTTRKFQWSQDPPPKFRGVLYPQYHQWWQQACLRSATTRFYNRSEVIFSKTKSIQRNWRGTMVMIKNGTRLRIMVNLPHPGSSASSSLSSATYLQTSRTCMLATSLIWKMVISSRSLI